MPAKPKAPAKPGRLANMADARKQRTAALATIKASLESLQSTEDDYQAQLCKALLPVRVKMGLHCLQAHMLFAVNPGKGGRPEKPSAADGLSTPQGFEGWLATEAPYIKKGSAYGYMKALKGLQLDETATEADVDAALAALMEKLESDGLPAPSLKYLAAASTEDIAPPAIIPPAPEQQEFDFLRGELSHYREFCDTLLNLRSQLEKYPDFHRAASSRAYHVLHELTGKHWQPSDHADELADIDPDTITV